MIALCSHGQVIKLYYLRRVRRIVPAFYLLVVVHVILWLWEGGAVQRNANAEANELALNLFPDLGTLRYCRHDKPLILVGRVTNLTRTVCRIESRRRQE